MHGDDALKVAILSRLLVLHPATLTRGELHREMHAEGFAARDAVDVAVDELTAAGLIHVGPMIRPTRAAVAFAALPF